jgi:site-specific DNA recombinase
MPKRECFRGSSSRSSRFARNTSDFLKYQKELKDRGVNLFSIKEGLDPSTKMGEFAMKLMSLIAEWEKETIKEQMRDNKMARWRDGRTFVGKPPFGYLWNQEAKRLEVNEREAAIYREIVQMYCGLSLSMADIAIRLNERGLKVERRPFSSPTVSDILKNPAYYGHYVLNKFIYETRKRGVGTKRTKQLKPESEHILFDIPALISKSEWDAIQVKTAFNKKNPNGPVMTSGFTGSRICLSTSNAAALSSLTTAPNGRTAASRDITLATGPGR